MLNSSAGPSSSSASASSSKPSLPAYQYRQLSNGSTPSPSAPGAMSHDLGPRRQLDRLAASSHSDRTSRVPAWLTGLRRRVVLRWLAVLLALGTLIHYSEPFGDLLQTALSRSGVSLFGSGYDGTRHGYRKGSNEVDDGVGIVVGSNGKFIGAPHGEWLDDDDDDAQGEDGNASSEKPTMESILRLDPNKHHPISASLLDGLLPFFSNHEIMAVTLGLDAAQVGTEDLRQTHEPLSVLGFEADDSYYLGDADFESYRRRLETFVQVAFPEQWKDEAIHELQTYFHAYPLSEDLTGPEDLPEHPEPEKPNNAWKPRPHHQPANRHTQDDQVLGGRYRRRREIEMEPAERRNAKGASAKGVRLKQGLPVRFGSTSDTKSIWQTAKSADRIDTGASHSWRENGEGWEWRFLDDQGGEDWVRENLQESKVAKVYHALPNGILHSDMLRYLVLCFAGGIYSDIDTRRLKDISLWGEHPHLFQNGRGWWPHGLKSEDLPGPSIVVGVEADVGDRQDWHDWWARPLQIVQWTMASNPFHPIFIDTLLQITRQTAYVLDWEYQKRAKVKKLYKAGFRHEAQQLEKATVMTEPKEGGPLGVIHWTGPGVFTDSVIRYMHLKYGFEWTDLKSIRGPVRVGELAVLPSTGFSPGVGLHGAGYATDPEAMVEHYFHGSWKQN